MEDVLPQNVRTHLYTKSAQGQSVLVKESIINIQHTNNYVRLTTAKQLDEVGSIEARAVDKILQLPKMGNA